MSMRGIIQSEADGDHTGIWGYEGNVQLSESMIPGKTFQQSSLELPDVAAELRKAVCVFETLVMARLGEGCPKVECKATVFLSPSQA